MRRTVEITNNEQFFYKDFYYNKKCIITNFRIFEAATTLHVLIVTAIRAVAASPRQLVVSQKRFRSKINIQRPQKLFYERALVTEFTTPFFVPKQDPVPIWEKCTRAVKIPEKTETKSKTKTEKPLHPYLRILARECLERHRASKMTAIFHQNSMTQEEEFEFAVLIHKYQMYIKGYGLSIIRPAFKDTEFAAATKLYGISSLTVFSPEVNVQALRKAVKKTPQLTLLAGMIDGKLLSCNDFLKYGTTTLTEARSQLVHTLQMAGGMNLNRQLNHHQTTLVSRLQQIGKSEEATEENVSGTEEANSEEAKPE